MTTTLIDTHAHVHDKNFHIGELKVIEDALSSGVKKIITIGTDTADSLRAIKYAESHKNVWASAGIHPHEASKELDMLPQFSKLVTAHRVVAIGECGLDYWYEHATKEDQKKVLRYQLALASSERLPLVFHIRGSKNNPRDAYDDFWPIFDEYPGLRGVVHSFTATQRELKQCLSRDLFIALNGIMTFTNDSDQLAAASAIPLEKLLLETDAPFLTPAPFRGTINQPKYVELTARFLADLRSESFEDLARQTTKNAEQLFVL